MIKLLKNLLPTFVSTQLHAFKILSLDYGHLKSIRSLECLDKHANPIPWYTYPALEFIQTLDFSNKTIFEFGSGNSTIFWSNLSKKIYSIEDNKHWYNKIKSSLQKENISYSLKSEREDYINAIDSINEPIDVIVVDGSYRLECAKIAVKKISGDGIIILDNSDTHPDTASYLRANNFIEVEFRGFGPINGFPWSTTFYFSRNASFPRKKTLV